MNREQWYKEFLANDSEASARTKLIAEATKEATAVFQKHFPNEKHNLEAPEVLAACLEMFDLTDPKDAGQLYLEWLVDHYVGRKVAANLDDVRTIAETLKARGFTEDNVYDYNDLDNRLFYIPHIDKLIFCIETQNHRFIYILTTDTFHPKFHIRRYYDEYDFESKDWWQEKEEMAYLKGGIGKAIANASGLNETWSDYIPGNQFSQRPSLLYFEERGFNPKYSDCRDNGYVLSYEDLISPRADRALFFYPEVKSAFLQLRYAVSQLEEME